MGLQKFGFHDGIVGFGTCLAKLVDFTPDFDQSITAGSRPVVMSDRSREAEN